MHSCQDKPSITKKKFCWVIPTTSSTQLTGFDRINAKKNFRLQQGDTMTTVNQHYQSFMFSIIFNLV